MEPERTALLTAVVRSPEAAAIGDALGLFALLMAACLIVRPGVPRAGSGWWCCPRLGQASRTVAKAARVLIGRLEPTGEAGADLEVAVLWRALGKVVSRPR
ncbi:hypothetical protein [Kitasatospora griseola]|uniref:hypothetical protein n=1 Tax=Kitasatospora griseola TaxID=2064 RepID=UPI0034370BB4